jgi:hypothetical protein
MDFNNGVYWAIFHSINKPTIMCAFVIPGAENAIYKTPQPSEMSAETV